VNLKLLLFIALITISSIAQNKNKTIGFKENKGQIIDQKGKPNNAVKYLLNSGGLNVQLRKNGFSYDVYEAKKHTINNSHNERKKPLPFPSIDNEKLPDYTLEYQFHRIDIDFLNSNPKVELITEEKSLDYDNYYNIPNKPEGVLMVHQYKQITYKNIYPNIDVVFTVPKDTLKTVEYNFVVHPKGKISDIQLKFSGAQTELVDNKIRMSVRFGEMEETLPASWTEDGELKMEIPVGYTKIKKNVYGFESSENVSDKTVIIDPVPTRLWGTLYGEGEYNYFTDIDSDINGNSYITGFTLSYNSSNFFASAGAHQSTKSTDEDGFIAKFDSNGKRVWGTYYGGELKDNINALKIDHQNNIIITGVTESHNNISTNGSYRATISDLEPGSGGNYDDVFIVKFNSSGVRSWGTYFGGQSDETAFDVDIDNLNNIYIVGKTNSKINIAINSSFQTQLNQEQIPIQYPDPYDGFLTKFTTDGNLIWSTYVGGEKDDIIRTIKVASNYLILGGETTSLRHISTPNVHLENHYDEEYFNDGTVYKFNLEGNRIWGTYYGWKSFSYSGDIVNSVDVDNEDNIYIGGNTDSENNISTIGSFQEIKMDGAGLTGFLAKLNSQGKRIWGTYIGSHTTISSLIFKNSFIYIGGTGGWKNKPITTSCAYRDENYQEGYWGKFTKNGNLSYGTCVGGESYYKAQKISITNNNVIIGGITDNNNGIADANSYQQLMNGRFNFYLMKFSDDTNINTPEISSNSPVCIGKTLELKASGGTNYSWTGPNGFTSTDQNPTIPNATAINSGEYSCLITGNGGCDETKKVNVVIGDIEAPVPTISNLQTITGDCHTSITTIPTATDACAGAIIANTANPLSYSLPGTYTIVWDYDDGNNNISHQNQTVTISNQPLPTATSPQTFCIQQNAALNDIAITTGQNLKWYDTLTTGSLLLNTTPLQNGNTYYASQTINGCESERIPVTVTIQNTLAPTGNVKQSFCTSQNPTLSNLVVVGSAIKWYDSATLGNFLTYTTPLVDGETYFATQTENNCESTNRIAITVSLISSLPANNYDFSICDDLNDGSEYVKLGDYNSYLISNTANYTFAYYESLLDAENEVTSNKITTASNYKLSLGENTIYVRINSNTPCYAIAVLKITLVPKPIIPIQDIVPICEKKSILIDAGSGADSYLWSNGKTTQTITVDNPGDLSVTVTKNHNTISCSSTKSFTIKTSNIAKINAIETKDWTDNDNTITVFVTGSGDFEYSIDGHNYQDSNTFSGVNSGEYIVQVRDKNGCGTATEEVYLLMYPKFFTPNGDSFNDTWKIKSSDTENELTIKIFDRFGKLLKELDSKSIGWDGTYIGQTLPATDYWFVVTRKNGKEYKGHFSLKR